MKSTLTLFWLFLFFGFLDASPARSLSQDGNSNLSAGERFQFKLRASQLDPRAREHPEVEFVFEKDGKPADLEYATVDTRVPARGKLVIWLMPYRAELFDRLASYGLHAIQVHYANGWFKKLNRATPPDDEYLGRIRLEAATGTDCSLDIEIPQADGVSERAHQLVKHLAKVNPEGGWSRFINSEGGGLRWNDVILSGSSHGSTTAARFAIHQSVDRVVMFSGPRDQMENWYSLPSATAKNRFFGFTHVEDGGWKEDHYCRSWELLGLNAFGPVVDVEDTGYPFSNSRRLTTKADVQHDANRAHGSSSPGNSAIKDGDGKFVHEEVWKYLFTHPIEQVGAPVDRDPNCNHTLR